jgi:hypothetical protein
MHVLILVLLWGGFGALVIWGLIRADQVHRGKRPPPEPKADISPFMSSLISGETSPAYTAPVNAVTPGGIRVRQARCCARGHVSPALAVKHADAVRRRIETTGR